MSTKTDYVYDEQPLDRTNPDDFDPELIEGCLDVTEGEAEVNDRVLGMLPPENGGGDPSNPNPTRVTDAMWWFWRRFKELEPEVLLGGIYANKSGYHNTRDANRSSWPNNYSIREAEDQGGPGDKAAAIDLTFPSAQRGDYRTIAKYCQRLMASSLDQNDPRLDYFREWYGQTDSDADVEGYDTRHLRYASSDNSHLWHIHVSVDRCWVTEYKAMRALLSVLRGDTVQTWVDQEGGTTPTPTPTRPTVPVAPPWPGRYFEYDGPGGRPNVRGDDVRAWQNKMQQRGWTIGVDGDYGPQSRDVCTKFQREKQLQVDGIVGPVTWDKTWTAPVT